MKLAEVNFFILFPVKKDYKTKILFSLLFQYVKFSANGWKYQDN